MSCLNGYSFSVITVIGTRVENFLSPDRLLKTIPADHIWPMGHESDTPELGESKTPLREHVYWRFSLGGIFQW